MRKKKFCLNYFNIIKNKVLLFNINIVSLSNVWHKDADFLDFIVGFLMKLFVGNLPNSMTEDELTSQFTEYGDIDSLKIIYDRETGRSRGFGFVEMSNADAQKAIDGLNNTEIQGRNISVNEARERR